jgi:hypothetical protein
VSYNTGQCDKEDTYTIDDAIDKILDSSIL